MSQTPAGGEGTVQGAAGILGVNNLQRAIDSFDRSVGILQTVAQKWSQASSGYQAGSKAAGSWNNASNWAGGSNGGTATFGGTPFNPNPSAGTPGAAGGAHRAAGPAAYQSTSGGGGAHRGAGNGAGKAAFAFGMASSALSGLNAATGQSKESGQSDSMLYLTTANAMDTGQGTSSSVLARSVYGSVGWSAQNGQDAARGNYSLFQNSGSSAMFSKMQQATAAQTLSSPMMTYAQAASSTNSLYSVPGMIGLHRVGINTIGKGGSRQTPLQVANQVLAQIDPQQVIRDPEDIRRLISDPASNLRMTLGNWVAGGVISGDQVQPIIDNVQTILKARAHGTDFNQLQSLMNTYKPGNASAKKLASMNIGNSATQDVKSLDASKRQRTINELGGFEKGLEESTSALTQFNTVLNGILGSTGISGLMGLLHGGTANGKLGAVLGLAGGVGGSVLGEAGNLAGGALHAGGSALSAGAHIFGIGGSNEGRMSVTSGAGGGGASGGGGSGGGGAGAAVSAGSGGGASKGGTSFIYPVNPHPVTEAYGVANSMYAAGHHTGVDFGVPVGTPVYASAAGTVVNSGPGGAYGNYVVIDHHCGLWTLYAHNSRLVVRVGQQVSQRGLIAYSGNTGNTTGPHCHFEMRKGANRYGADVNPMPYLGGASSPPVTSTGGTASGPSTGSGSSTTLGSGTSYTDTTTTSSLYSGSGFSAGMSELDVLGAGGGMSAGGGGSTMTTTTSSPSGGGSGSPTGGSTSTGGLPPVTAGGGIPGAPGGPNNGKRYSAVYNRGVVSKAATAMGWGSTKEWDSLYQLIQGESSWNNVAQNPTSTAYGLFQFLDSTWASYGGKKTSDPTLQTEYGMRYIKARYGDPIHAEAFKRAHNWYDKGAWEIKQDEDARVHKGEMILQKPAADQIRQVLLNGNPYGAMGNKAGQGVTLQFNDGSIRITIQGGGSSPDQARALGKGLVDEIFQDTRIQNLQKGVLR